MSDVEPSPSDETPRAAGDGPRPVDYAHREETPPRALALSALALAVAGLAAFVRPPGGQEYLAFLWVLLLIPPFLLSYYRGWSGAVIALAGGMAVLVGAELAGRVLLEETIHWWIFGSAAVGLVAVSLGAGVTSEALHRTGAEPQRFGAREARMREIRRAIDEGELVLHYQPIVSFADRRVRGLEALVRWQHPTRGLVGPNEFISFAESTGLIVPLGNWVLEEALRHHHRWRDRFSGSPELFVSVNVTTAQCRQAGFRERVRSVLRAHGVEPAGLQLEVTEGALREAAAELTDVEGLGVSVAVDDFGQGYVSLGQLSRFPIDGVKIDGSFVAGMTEDSEDRALVESVVRLCKSLDLGVTAEGVETEGQFEELKALGCDWGQGYFFADPFPVAALESGLLPEM